LLELLNAQKQTQQPQQPVTQGNDDPKPNLANFQDYDEYMSAHAAWTARNEYRRIRTEETKAEQARQFAAQQQQQKQSQEKYVSEVASSWAAVSKRGEERFPDFEEKVFGIPAEHMPATIAEAIATSPVGDEVAYYLGTHREIIKQIAAMSPINQIKEIAKLEIRAGKSAQSNAPTPITPVQGGAINDALNDTDSFAEWERKREAQIKKRRGY
jgi:site-specific DNA-cytosine methylase